MHRHALAPGGTGAPTAAGRRQPKAITIAFPIDPTALAGSMLGLGAAAVPSRYFKEFNNAYLTTYNAQDEPVPWLVTDLPSLDDGTWKVLDDGRMEVTWKLRLGIKWHDGAELTSDDLKFSWEITKDLTTAVAPQGVARYIEAVATPDPYTALFTWTQASQLGAQAGVREFDVLPRHLLEGAERAGLSNNPYFSDPGVFVGSGPFRPVAWDQGSSMTLEAFDGYFLGRPKIDRVTFSLITDAQAAMANMLAGQVDIAYWTISYEGARIIQQEWSKSGGGTVEMQANQAGFLSRFNSALIATAQNRWAGNNRNGYANPAADDLLNRVDRTLRRDDRMAVWAEANRVLVDDLAFMPLYNYPYPYLVRKGVIGPTPGNPINPPSYFAHTWDLQ